jgi:hypothetical protein
MADSTRPAEPIASGTATDGGDLPTHGYARYGPGDLELDAFSGRWREDLARLSRDFDDLPCDSYDPQDNRLRRYAHAVHLPWDDTLSWIPDEQDADKGSVAEYHQTRHPDYDHGRHWPGIPAKVRDNALLLHLMRVDARRTLWRKEHRRSPLYLAVHLVKLAAQTAGDAAVASPNCVHQDGDNTFVFAHLISRRNVGGGENLIARPECAGRQPDEVAPADVHAAFTLHEPLESYGLYDPLVSHYVAPVRRGDGAGPGERCMLLIGVAAYALRL